MYKLIKKRGIISTEVNSLSKTVFIRINDIDCTVRFDSINLHEPYMKKGDDIEYIGYWSKDEYSDTLFYVCAWINHTSMKKSDPFLAKLFFFISMTLLCLTVWLLIFKSAHIVLIILACFLLFFLYFIVLYLKAEKLLSNS